VNKTHNLDFTGRSIEGLVKHLTEKASADETDVVTKLRENLTMTQAEKDAIANEYGTYKTRLSLHKEVPTVEGKNPEHLLAMAAVDGITFKEEKGVLTPYKDGKVWVNDKLQTPLSHSEAIKTYAEQIGWGTNVPAITASKTGRGGDNQPPSGTGKVPLKLSEFTTKWTSENPDKNINGEDFQNALWSASQAATAAGQTFSLSE
jgi:hypothetical protein